MGSRLCNKILSIVFFALVASLQDNQDRFKRLTVLLFEKYYLLLSRLSMPKEAVLGLLPMVMGKAVLLIIENKIIEKVGLLFEASHTKGGVCSAENMAYLFCTGLFTTNCV